jgi:hypothetical protein
MGATQTPLKVKLFIAVLYDADARFDGFLDQLTAQFGPTDQCYGPIPFSYSNYYAEEMGTNLLKWYATFKPLFEREKLPDIKNRTNALERREMIDGKRRFNADPGYIARDKLALASTKDFYHRLYIGEGVFGEVTLHFRKGQFRHFSWTYPDYQDSAFLTFLTKVRAGYMREIRQPQ